MVDATTSVGRLREHVRQFVHAREWERFHTPKDLAMAISIEASELLELFLWGGLEARPEMSSEQRTPVGDELADVMIYGLRLANVLDIDLFQALRSKLQNDQANYWAGRLPGPAR